MLGSSSPPGSAAKRSSITSKFLADQSRSLIAFFSNQSIIAAGLTACRTRQGPPRPGKERFMATTERDDGRIEVGSRTVHPALVLTVLATAAFVAVLDVWITNVGLPAIGKGVGERSLSNLSWVLSAYAIVYAALLVPAGGLADLLGRKRGFLPGLTLFG